MSVSSVFEAFHLPVLSCCCHMLRFSGITRFASELNALWKKLKWQLFLQ